MAEHKDVRRLRSIFRWTSSPQELAPFPILAYWLVAPASSGLSLCRSWWITRP